MQYPANGLKTNDTSILILNIIYIYIYMVLQNFLNEW